MMTRRRDCRRIAKQGEMGQHYILYGHGGSYNHGAEAITKCTIDLLRNISPGCKISLSTHFPEQDKEFGIQADEFLSRNVDGKTNQEIYASTLNAISENCVVIHVGGDNYCYKNWERYAEIHNEAIKKGAKSILWGCSIDEDKMSEEMLEVLASHTLILAREPITYRALIRRGMTNVRKVSDIAFALPIEKIDFTESNYAVINVSPLVCRINPAIKDSIRTLIDYILQNTNLKIVLLPHVMVSVDNDYEQLRQYVDFGSERICLISDKMTASQYKYIVSQARFCVASRTHVTIAAYSSGVPTIALGYSTKARGIGEDLGMSEYVIDVEDEDFENSLLQTFSKLMEEEKMVGEMLRNKMTDYQKQIVDKKILDIITGEQIGCV